MRKSGLALAVLAALPLGGTAHAQTSIQIHGLTDAGDSVVKVIPGGRNTSRRGFKVPPEKLCVF